MNAVILLIIGVPAIEIYLMIKVGGIIGALNTILLIFFYCHNWRVFRKNSWLKYIKIWF